MSAASNIVSLPDPNSGEGKPSSAHFGAQPFFNLMNALPMPLVIMDHGKVIVWNSAAEELFGWPRNEVVGKPMPGLREGASIDFEHLVKMSEEGNMYTVGALPIADRHGLEMNVDIYAAPVHAQLLPHMVALAIRKPEIGVTARHRIAQLLTVIAGETEIALAQSRDQELFGPRAQNVLRAVRQIASLTV